MSVRKYKILKSTIVSVLLVAFGGWVIHQGVDATSVAYIVLMGLLLINGIELSELYAVLAEAKQRSNNDDQ
jgi:hypothetical protein